MKTKIEKSSLSSQYPDIAAEWNYEKNALLTPQMISYGSGKKVWWKHHFQNKQYSFMSKKLIQMLLVDIEIYLKGRKQ